MTQWPWPSFRIRIQPMNGKHQDAWIYKRTVLLRTSNQANLGTLEPNMTAARNPRGKLMSVQRVFHAPSLDGSRNLIGVLGLHFLVVRRDDCFESRHRAYRSTWKWRRRSRQRISVLIRAPRRAGLSRMMGTCVGMKRKGIRSGGGRTE
jgi:hypothetical protein